MFNGIIRNIGVIKSIKSENQSMILGIHSNMKVSKMMIGSSISCNGVCLTLTSYKNKILYFYLSKETINRSNFSKVRKENKVNLEKSLKYGDEISGHYVQGHVDTTGKVVEIKINNKTWILKISINSKFNKFIVEKASIHINGVSLTVSKKFKNCFEVNVIPHTLKLTTLKNLKKKDLVNIEFDIFGKYLYEINK
jgi:riboflavin synthase, alpha subunit